MTRAPRSPFGPLPLRGNVLRRGFAAPCRTTFFDNEGSNALPGATNKEGPTRGPSLFGGEGGITRPFPGPHPTGRAPRVRQRSRRCSSNQGASSNLHTPDTAQRPTRGPCASFGGEGGIRTLGVSLFFKKLSVHAVTMPPKIRLFLYMKFMRLSC